MRTPNRDEPAYRVGRVIGMCLVLMALALVLTVVVALVVTIANLAGIIP